MTLFSSIKRLLFDTEERREEENLSLEFSGTIQFTLKIGDLVIGYLRVVEGNWSFEYSEAFRTQDTYRRLAGFSDLNKIYTSKVLWPFFKIRIPGLKQPMVREIIEAEGLDVTNEVQLLSRFGRVTMSNPYILEVN